MAALLAFATVGSGEEPTTAMEQAASAAEAAGRAQEALLLYTQAWQALPDPAPEADEQRLLERLVKLATRLTPPPVAPEEANRRLTRGLVLFKEAHDQKGYADAAAEFRAALRVAPWFAPALFNLALTEEKLGAWSAAMRHLKLHLLTGVDPERARQVQAKVYEFELRAERQERLAPATRSSAMPAARTTSLVISATGSEPTALAPGEAVLDMQAALDSPLPIAQIPLRMTAYVFEEAGPGRARTLVAAEVDVRGLAFRETGERSLGSVEFLLVVWHRQSGERFSYAQKIDMKLSAATREKLVQSWLPVQRDFQLAPGSYVAKIVVRDAGSLRIGTLIHDFEVPPLRGLRLSTPVLSDTLLQDDPSGIAKASPLARRTLARGGMVYCSFDVYGATRDPQSGMPRVVAGVTILGRDGQVVGGQDLSPIRPTSLGRVSRLAGLFLREAPAGDYVAVLSVKDEVSGSTIEQRESFSIS